MIQMAEMEILEAFKKTHTFTDQSYARRKCGIKTNESTARNEKKWQEKKEQEHTRNEKPWSFNTCGPMQLEIKILTGDIFRFGAAKALLPVNKLPKSNNREGSIKKKVKKKKPKNVYEMRQKERE